MATVDMYTPYPKNLLDAMKRYSLAANLEWPITEKQFKEMMGDPNMPRMAHLTLREEEIIEVRYKVYHTAEEAGKLIHPSVSRTRFCALEARLFIKLRRYVIRYLHIHGKEEEAGERENKMMGAEKTLVNAEQLPSAQPERKRGKWIRYDGDWLKTMCKCSECGAMIDINEKYRNFFCYHCGARMEGE